MIRRFVLAALAAALALSLNVAAKGGGQGVVVSPAAGGDPPGDLVLRWELDATSNDDMESAATTGPQLTVTRAGAGKTRVDSSGNIDEVAADTILADYWWNGSTFVVRGFRTESVAHLNGVRQSEDLGTTWANIGVTTPTLSTNTTTIGDLDLDLLGDDDAVVAAEGKEIQIQSLTGTTTRSVSYFIKEGTSTSSVVVVRDTTAGADRYLATITWSGGVPTVTQTTGTHIAVERLNSSVYRVMGTTTSAVNSANTNMLRLYPAANSSLAVANTGTIEFGGMQVENAQTWFSSYTPTTTASVTVPADVVTVSTASISGFDSSQLTMMWSGYTEELTGQTYHLLALDANAGNDNESQSLRTTISGGGFQVRDNSTTQAGLTAAAWGNHTVFKKVVGASAVNNFKTCADGGAPVTDTAGTLPTVTTLRAGNISGGAPTIPMGHFLYNAELYSGVANGEQCTSLSTP